jgi:hypothetical protein
VKRSPALRAKRNPWKAIAQEPFPEGEEEILDD